jgi:hypothetical protein
MKGGTSKRTCIITSQHCRTACISALRFVPLEASRPRELLVFSKLRLVKVSCDRLGADLPLLFAETRAMAKANPSACPVRHFVIPVWSPASNKLPHFVTIDVAPVQIVLDSTSQETSLCRSPCAPRRIRGVMMKL